MIYIKKGICRIQSNEKVLGTGFYVGNGKIITAAHVTEGKDMFQAVFIDIDKEIHAYKATVYEMQPDTDICILIVTGDELLETVKLNYNFGRVPIGNSFYTYGYPGENMSQGTCIEGTILNAHDGVQMSEYNVELVVTKGALENYAGISGAPVIIDSKVVGICVYQDVKKLRMIEFYQYKEELEECINLKMQNKKQWISNMPDVFRDETLIQNIYPKSAIRALILSGDACGPVIVRGSNGSGKTVWTELLDGDDKICVLGKYFIRRNDDTYSTVYRKNEDALYDWFCDMVVAFGQERVHVKQHSSYSERVKSVQEIIAVLERTMEGEGKHGLICIDGLDEFATDDPHVFESFCSYFSSIRMRNLHLIITVTNENILPQSIQQCIQETQIFDISSLSESEVRTYLLDVLNIPGIRENVDQLVEKIEGHPLYLHYLIESLKHMTTEGEITYFVEKLPAYGGNIHTYYAYRWSELMRDENQITCATYLSAVRKPVEKQIFLQMIPQEKRIAFDLSLKKMGGLLLQENVLAFFHTSFQQYVIEQTMYFQESVHHSFAKYCINHQDVEYGITQQLYHLSCGDEQDQKDCIQLCNQEWMDKCTLFDTGMEEMLHDMRMVLGMCCDQGNMAQLIDKLLLMQRAEVRYNDMFVRFAFEAALAEIELNRPQKAIGYLYRQHCFMVSYEQLFVCLVRMVDKGQGDCADDLFSKMEAAFFRKVQDGQAMQVEAICYLIRGYQLLAWADDGLNYQYYMENLKLFNQIIFSQRLDEVCEHAFLQASSDFVLWSKGEAATEERMMEENLTINQYLFDIWLLTISGANGLMRILSKKGNSYDVLLNEIVAHAEAYEWNESYTNMYVNACMNIREYASKIPKDKIPLPVEWEMDSIRATNGVEIDINKVWCLFQLYRNKAFIDEQPVNRWEQEEWQYNWESLLVSSVRFVAGCYGIGLVRKNMEDLENMKNFLKNGLFSFDTRVTFKDAYHIPEGAMEFLMGWVSEFFLVLFPEEKHWYTDYVIIKAEKQFGVYYESYFRIMIEIAKSYLRWLPDEGVPVVILKKIFLDIIQKVANRYERTKWLLQLISLMARSGCTELADKVYKEMLRGSMGPWWYKESQFTLLEQMFKDMKQENIQAAMTNKAMALLDAASGGMTFERYIRTAKEDVIAVLWKRRQYSQVLKYVQVQLLPEDWQSAILSEYEPVDRKNEAMGSYRVTNCIFPQRLVKMIVEDEHAPDIYRWIFSEIFLLAERRHMHDYAGIQAEILKKSGKKKKVYIDRIIQILLCDAGDYYFEDLLNCYSDCLDESDYQIIIELVEEITGKQIQLPQTGKMANEEYDLSDEFNGGANVYEKEREEMVLPGTWGHSSAEKQAEKLWEDVEKEEERDNTRHAVEKCIEVINVLEKGGWTVWSETSSKIGNNAIHKIAELSEEPSMVLKLLKEDIVWPKYVSGWNIVEELLKILVPELSEEETVSCYKAVMGHYEEMMTIPDNLINRYLEEKYHVISEQEAFFALLLQFVVSPEPYFSQKSMEMLSWLIREQEMEIDNLVKYCFFDELETAEICSTLCLRLADTRNAVLKKQLEKDEQLAKRIIECQWAVVRCNMFLVLRQYQGRSTLLKEQYQLLVEEMVKDNKASEVKSRKVEQMEADGVIVPENIQSFCDDKMLMSPQNLEAIYKYTTEESLQKIGEVFESTRKNSLLVYAEQLFAGYHNSNLREYPWRKKWFEVVNQLDYIYNNEAQVIAASNALRRVNCHFPINYAWAAENMNVYHVIRKVFNTHDVSILADIFEKEKFVAGFQAVDLKHGEPEILTLRSFIIPKNMEDKTGIMTILKKKVEISANMYPFIKKQSSLESVSELSMQNTPGCMIGLDISDSILDKECLLNLGMGKSDFGEQVYINERRWDNNMGGRPDFLSVSGWINDGSLRLPEGYRLMIFAELESNNRERQWMFLDKQTHRVTFI